MPILQKRKLRHTKVESAAQAAPTSESGIRHGHSGSAHMANCHQVLHPLSDRGLDVQGPRQGKTPDCVNSF